MDPVEDTTDVLRRFVDALEQSGVPYSGWLPSALPDSSPDPGDFKR
jgi:hypothetical protein